MADQLKDILDAVAAGALSPEQAHSILTSTEPPPADAVTATHSEPPEPPAASASTAASGGSSSAQSPVDDLPDIARITVRGSAVKLTITADPEVTSAEVVGPHRREQTGDELLITSDLADDGGTPQPPRSSFLRLLDAGTRAGSTLTIRVNPFLPLDVLAVAGSLELAGVRAPVSVGLEAGSAKLGPGSGPLQLSVSSASADVDWLFVGNSSISVDVGSARVTALPGSDVVITAESSAGSASIITASGAPAPATASGGQSTTVGNGAGSLTANARLGSVSVRVVA